MALNRRTSVFIKREENRQRGKEEAEIREMAATNQGTTVGGKKEEKIPPLDPSEGA